MPLDPKRKGDIKVIVGATMAVLLVGLFIFGAILVTTRGGSGIQCGQLNIGAATGVRNNLENGPYFQTGGGRCGSQLAANRLWMELSARYWDGWPSGTPDCCAGSWDWGTNSRRMDGITSA